MFRESLIGKLWFAILGILSTYNESWFYKKIMKCAAKIRGAFLESAIHRFFTSPTARDKYYETSLIYRLIDAVFDFVVKILKKIYEPLRKINQGGINNCIYTKLHDTGLFKYEYILSAFLAIMLALPHERWNNAYAVLAAFGFTALYVILVVSGRRFARRIKGIDVMLMIFIISIGASIGVAYNKADAMRISLFVISAVLFAQCIYGSVMQKKDMKVLITVILTGVLITAFYAIYQGIIGVEVSLEYTDVYTNAGMPGRVYANFANPNNYAEMLVLFLPFVYAMFIIAKSKRQKCVWAGFFVVILSALALTYSRSCWVAFAIATVVFIALYDWRLILPLALVAVMAVPFLPASIMNRILTIGSLTDSSNSYRLYVWEGVLRMIKENWLIGIGAGPDTFAKIYPRYAHMFATTAPHSHMLYLELFVEFGLIGGLSFFIYLFNIVKRGLGSYSKADKELKVIIIAAISALLGISFVCAAEYIWFYPRVMFAYWTVLGILLASVRMVNKAELK